MSLTRMIGICACVSVYAAGTAMMLPFKVWSEVRKPRSSDDIEESDQPVQDPRELDHETQTMEVMAGESIPSVTHTTATSISEDNHEKVSVSSETSYDVIDSKDVPAAMTSVDDECEPCSDTTTDTIKSRSGKKHWFLVKSKTGAIRACEAWEPTPKTIAGPFPTKEDALLAKEKPNN